MDCFLLVLYTLLIGTVCANNNESLPFRIPSEVLDQCKSPISSANIAAEVDAANVLLNVKYGPAACTCGGSGTWKRVAFLDMSDPQQQCPGNWTQIETPVRACAGFTPGCHSAVFSTGLFTYSHVCGRVLAYQKGSPDAFNFWDTSPKLLEGSYLEGVSLSHGRAGSRQHIWSFVASVYETSTPYLSQPNCACTNTDYNWPYQVPSFIGNNYFCDTGNNGSWLSTAGAFLDNPLWDGKGCGPTNSCCQLNKPPWFCTSLPQTTSDDLELRICGTESNANEDIYVYFVEIYASSE